MPNDARPSGPRKHVWHDVPIPPDSVRAQLLPGVTSREECLICGLGRKGCEAVGWLICRGYPPEKGSEG